MNIKSWILERIILAAIIIVLIVLFGVELTSQPTLLQSSVPPSGQPQSTPVSDTPVITWQRDGGIAGFCDKVTIYTSGKAHVVSCKSSNTADILLSSDQLRLLNDWKTSLKGFTYSHKDDSVADAMSISLVFAGTGLNEGTDGDFQAISSFVSSVAIQSGH